MHLLTFMHLRKPGLLLRTGVVLTQVCVWGGCGRPKGGAAGGCVCGGGALLTAVMFT